MRVYNRSTVRSWKYAITGLVFLYVNNSSAESNYRELAERTALRALDDPNKVIVARGIAALTALGSVGAIPKIVEAYHRFLASNDVTLETRAALDRLIALPGGDVAILETVRRLHRQHGGSAQDPYQDGNFYSAFTTLGPKAVDVLPTLLKTFESEGVYNAGMTSPVIAAIGLRTEAQVDTVLDSYSKSRIRGGNDPLIVLKGIPHEFRNRAVQRFLTLLSDPEAYPSVDKDVPVRALGVLQLATPQVTDKLEELAKTGNPLQQVALSSLALVIAANPDVADRVLQRKVYPADRNLVEYLEALASEDFDRSAVDEMYPSRKNPHAPLAALANLCSVAPTALRSFSSFLYKQSTQKNGEARMLARYVAVSYLANTGKHAADLVLGIQPLPVYGTPQLKITLFDSSSPADRKTSEDQGNDPAYLQGLEKSVQQNLATSLPALGPLLQPALPQFLKALTANRSANNSRMLAYAVLQMTEPARSDNPAAAGIYSVLPRVSDPLARIWLLAAYLLGGGNPEKFLSVRDSSLNTVTDTSGSPIKTAVGDFPLAWNEVDTSIFAGAALQRPDFAWSQSHSAADIFNLMLRSRAGSADLVPFGPLTLDQTLLTLEGLLSTEGLHITDDGFHTLTYWALILAPDLKKELEAVRQLATPGGLTRLPSDLAGIRTIMPLLATDLRRSWPEGKLRYAIAPALAELYRRGTGQWAFSTDAPMLSNVAQALEQFGAGPDPLSTEASIRKDEEFLAEAAKLRSNAGVEAKSIREWLITNQELKSVNRDAFDLNQKRSIDRQEAEAQRMRLIAIILTLAVALLLFFIVVFSVRLRRRILLLAGRRWSLVSAEYCGTVEITETNAVFRPATGSQSTLASFRADTWPPPGDQISHLKAAFEPGWNIRVLVTEQQFRRPWAHVIGSPWSEADQAIVAGQLCLVQRNGAARRTPVKNIAFAAFSCAHAPDAPRLPGVDAEVALVERSFRRWGATVSPAVRNATVEDALSGLMSVDIVHVAAHASCGGIYLNDRFLNIRDIERVGLERLRCRLLVLSCCDAGRIEEEHSFVFALVRSGVNVLAARSPVLDQACVIFFEEFYNALLPAKQAEGIDIGTSIRRASEACIRRFARIDVGPLREQTEGQLKQTIDSFTFFGDPAAQFRLVLPSRS
jgi:hypothetical protein